jgi:putative transposase
MSELLACTVVGLAHATYQRLSLAATPARSGCQLRAWLRASAVKYPCHGFRRAWLALRHDGRREVTVMKVHRLWRGECRQVAWRA